MALDPETALGFLHRWGYLLVLVTGIGEAIPLIGIFTPGHVVIIVAGAAAGAGALDVRTLIVVALVAGIVGDVPGFYLGRHYGRAALSRLVERAPRVGRAAAASDALFERRGAFALVLCRFSFLTRSFGPLLAGVSRMPARTFWIYNVVGALLWAVGNALLGYFFGLSFIYVEGRIGRILAYSLLVAIGLALVYHALRRFAPAFTRGDMLVAALAITASVGFGVVAETVAREGSANAFDAHHAEIARLFAPLGALQDGVKIATSFELLGALALVLVLVLALQRRVWEVTLVALGVGGVLLLVAVVRSASLFSAPRLAGFPSAHAAVAIVAASVGLYLVAQRASRRAALAWTAAIALACALAEVAYLGDERPTVVLGGLLLGLAWSGVAVLLVEFGVKRDAAPPRV